jgi:hypothetical protein
MRPVYAQDYFIIWLAGFNYFYRGDAKAMTRLF